MVLLTVKCSQHCEDQQEENSSKDLFKVR